MCEVLIQVLTALQVSEFANNDLEKYSKALDNAILKYHSIKMDEINDTIGHLWNKTYQGTGTYTLFLLLELVTYGQISMVSGSFPITTRQPRPPPENPTTTE
jgi:hypothetical protein